MVTKADENEDDRLPEGFVVEGGSMEAKYTGLYPVDSSIGSLATIPFGTMPSARRITPASGSPSKMKSQ